MVLGNALGKASTRVPAHIEFHWHEGHCIFATEESCRTFTLDIINLFEDLVQNVLAIPVVKGIEAGSRSVPGAIDTYTIESMMQDGKALQMGTSHMLSQQFLIDSDGKATRVVLG